MRKLFREITKIIYNKLRYTNVVQSIEEEFEIQTYSAVTSRHYEYPYGVSSIVKFNKLSKIKTVLDAGSFGSPFGLILASLGFQVTGVDILDWEIKFPGFKQFKADLKNMPFTDNSFDAVCAISTLEHCGLPRFSEEIDKNGDIKAANELHRVLKKGGLSVITVPFAGKFRVFHNKHRIYNDKRIKRLLGKFKVIEKKFFAPIKKKNKFEPCSEAQIKKLNPYNNGIHGIICLLARK